VARRWSKRSKGGIWKAQKLMVGQRESHMVLRAWFPTIFSKDDPYWDIGAVLNTIDGDCRSGKIRDMVIIRRHDDSVNFYWRGISPLTTVLGMIEYAKEQVLMSVR